MASSGSKVSLGCWPISQSIGRDLEQKLNLLYVFNCGKSAILSTVDNDVYAVGLNPSAALGTGASQQCIFNPTKIQDVTGRLMYVHVQQPRKMYKPANHCALIVEYYLHCLYKDTERGVACLSKPHLS